jgi:hypothetical protein
MRRIFNLNNISPPPLRGGGGYPPIKLKIMLASGGFRGRRERFLNKILLVLKSFHPVLPIRKVKIFEKTTYHCRSQNESRHSSQDPPQSYAVFYALQFDMRFVNRKILQAKLLHKQFFKVFSVVRKIIDVRIRLMAQDMA